MTDCEVCGEPIKGKWDSQVYLGMETGELTRSGIHRWLIYDKHIKCSPSRAQRIVHPKFPTVVDDRPQYDWRPEADNTWTDEMRSKWKKVYTNAWVRLQQQYNPNWFEETHDLHALISHKSDDAEISTLNESQQDQYYSSSIQRHP